MEKMKKLYIISLIALAATIIGLAWAEQMTFSTYYPAPAGVYNQMVTRCLGVGDQTGDGLNYNDAPDPNDDDQVNDLWVAGQVGIGTTDPGRPLHIYNSSGGAEVFLEGQGSLQDIAGISLISDEGATKKRWTMTHRGEAIGTNRLQFQYHNGVTWISSLALMPDGNVGIGGTRTPDEKFEIEFESSSTDVEIGRGGPVASPNNTTFIKLRSANNAEYWVYPNNNGELQCEPARP